jgi:antitoxin MazE
MRVSNWGNSLAIRIPAKVAEALNLHEGDDVEILIAGEKSFEISKKPDAAALLKKLSAYRGKLPADFKFNRDDLNGR